MFATFGETLLQLEPPSGERLATAGDYRVYAAGDEAAAAVAARRADVPTRHTTVLPNSPLGERAAGELRHHDIELCVDHAPGRQPLVFRQAASAPAPERRVTDRADSALAGLDPDAVDPEPPGPDGCAYVTTGTLTASDAAAQVGGDFLTAAVKAGATAALGLLSVPDNIDAARAAIEKCMPAATALVATEAAVAAVFDRDGPPEQVAHVVATSNDLETVGLVRDRTLLAWHDATVFETDTLEADETDPAGAAAAFAGTFLARRLMDDGVERALAVGTAAHALARSSAGPLAAYSYDDLLAVAGQPEE